MPEGRYKKIESENDSLCKNRYGAAALNNMEGFNAAAPVAVLIKISYADKIKRKHTSRKEIKK